MKNRIIFLLTFTVVACQSKLQNTENSAENEVESEANTCLLDYSTRINELISKEEIAQIFELDIDRIGTQLNQFKNTSNSNYQVEWNDGRKLKMKSGLELPLDNSVYIGYIKQVVDPKTRQFSPFEAFQQMYRTRTEEEIRQMRTALKKKAEEEKINSETAESGGQILESAMKVEYEGITDLADAAVWRDYPETSGGGGELIVLLGDHTFQVTVNASEAQDYNRQKAILIAERILKVCLE
jgi:hypothetical protein